MKEQLFDPQGSARLRFLETVGETLPEETVQHRALLKHLDETIRKFNMEPPHVALAWQAAQLQAGLTAESRYPLFFLFLSVLIGEQQGNTRLPLADAEGSFLGPTFYLLLEDAPARCGWSSERVVEEVLKLLADGRASSVIGAPGEYKPLVLDPPHVWSHRMWLLEQRLAQRIAFFCRSQPMNEDVLRQALSEVTGVKGKRGITLNKDQRTAVAQAVQSPLCIISGGPGTGKTTIVVSILRLLARLGVEMNSIALAAPTGKAANRMQESIRNGLVRIPTDQLKRADWKVRDELGDARTLHRLLGFSPRDGSFRHHENNRLAETTVIVDEASMIDLYMIERLARSLRDDARLILLGDAEQLPSVDAGAILRDLTRAADVGSALTNHVVRLHESMRMDVSDPLGRHILLVARQANQGEPPEYRTPQAAQPEHALIERPSVNALAFEGVEFLEISSGSSEGSKSAAKVRSELLDRWHERFVRQELVVEASKRVFHFTSQGFSREELYELKRVFDELASFRILCLTRAYRTGAEATNEEMHYRQLRDRKERDAAFLAGEPILMNKNDYERMIFNGDQGIVLRVQYEGREQRMAVFPRQQTFAPFHLDSLRGRISLAYAMTVHKSQGSEFEHAMLLLPEKDLPINTRELLYTAITRCKRSMTVVGDKETFAKGVARKIDRFTGIAEAIGASGS